MLTHFLKPYQRFEYKSFEVYLSLVTILKIINTDQAIKMANFLLYCLSNEGPKGTLSISVSDQMSPFMSLDPTQVFYNILKQSQGNRYKKDSEIQDIYPLALEDSIDKLVSHILSIMRNIWPEAMQESISLAKLLDIDMCTNPETIVITRSNMETLLIQFFENAQTLQDKKDKIETLANALSQMTFTKIANTLIVLLAKADGINRDHLIQSYQFNYIASAWYIDYENSTKNNSMS